MFHDNRPKDPELAVEQARNDAALYAKALSFADYPLQLRENGDWVYVLAEDGQKVVAKTHFLQAAQFMEIAPGMLADCLQHMNVLIDLAEMLLDRNAKLSLAAPLLARAVPNQDYAMQVMETLNPCECACHPEGPCADCADAHRPWWLDEIPEFPDAS